MKQTPTSLLIADDSRLVRESYAQVLRATNLYTAETTDNNFASIEACIEKEIPAVILLDINIPDKFGLQNVKQLHREYPFIKLIGIVASAIPAYVKLMPEAGINGLITRRSSFDDLLLAFSSVLGNKRYISYDLKNELADQSIAAGKNGVELLSMRETEIIRLIRQEYSSKDIARLLEIAPKTVEAHRYNIQRKLGLRNVVGIINFAHRTGL